MCFLSKQIDTEIPKNEFLIEPLRDKDKFFPKGNIEQITCAWCRKWLENYEGYADKYKYAAEQLHKLSGSCAFDKDSLAYPIMFLARHAIELRLKSILWNLQSCNNKSHTENDTITKEHSLVKLWNDIDALYKGEKSKVYDLAYQKINELNIFDVKSDTFRYPIHTNRQPTSIKAFIDIDAFMSTFQKLNRFLEDLESETQEQLDTIKVQNHAKIIKPRI